MPVRSAMNRPGWRCSSHATTTAMSAMPPSATGHLAPVSRPPTTRALIAAASGLPLPSDRASQPISDPSASFGRYWWRWASDPAVRIASAAKYAVDPNGTGATARPISSANTHSPS